MNGQILKKEKHCLGLIVMSCAGREMAHKSYLNQLLIQ